MIKIKLSGVLFELGMAWYELSRWNIVLGKERLGICL